MCASMCLTTMPKSGILKGWRGRTKLSSALLHVHEHVPVNLHGILVYLFYVCLVTFVCVRACVHACMRACMCVHICVLAHVQCML